MKKKMEMKMKKKMEMKKKKMKKNIVIVEFLS